MLEKVTNEVKDNIEKKGWEQVHRCQGLTSYTTSYTHNTYRSLTLRFASSHTDELEWYLHLLSPSVSGFDLALTIERSNE